MENLFLALQKNKQFKRQITLLQHMRTIPFKISSTELAQVLHCSLPTLRDDINALNTNLSDYIKISSPSFGELALHCIDTVSIDSLIAILTKKTVVYQIIDNLCYGRWHSSQQVLDALLISRTNLQQILRHMNRTLQLFNISISTKKFSFIGKEKDIRVFLFAFYSEFGDRTIVLEDSTTYVERFLSMYQQTDLPRLHFCHFRLALWGSIAHIRRKQQRFVSLSEPLKKEITNQMNFLTFASFHRRFTDTNQLDKLLPTDEAVWAYITVLDCIAYTDVLSHAETPLQFVYRWEKCPKIIEEAHQFLTTTFSRTREFVTDDMMNILESFLINARLLMKASANFEVMTSPLKKMAIDMYNELYALWYQQLSQLPQGSNFRFDKVDNLAVSLTLFHASIRKQKQQRKKLRVLFAFQGRAGFDDYLAKFSKVLITDNMQADYFLERVIDKEVIVQLQAGLIICNYDLNIQEEIACPIVRIPNIPTLADWGRARAMIDRLTN